MAPVASPAGTPWVGATRLSTRWRLQLSPPDDDPHRALRCRGRPLRCSYLADVPRRPLGAPKGRSFGRLAPMTMEDPELRDLLRTLSPSARDHLRDVLIRDRADRDAIASQLLRYRDQNGDEWGTSSTC